MKLKWVKNSDGETLYWNSVTVVAKPTGYKGDVKVEIFIGSSDFMSPLFDRLFAPNMKCAKQLVKTKLMCYKHDMNNNLPIGLKEWKIKVNGKIDRIGGRTYSKAIFEYLRDNVSIGKEDIELMGVL